MERAIALEAAGHIVLPGNHEQMMWAALTGQDGGHDVWARWRRNGADAALKSYGITGCASPDLSRVAPSHIAFLNWLVDERPPYHIDRKDGLFFVHAGVSAEEGLGDQRRDVLLWSRLAQAEDPKWVEGLHVIHGHTPRPAPEKLRHRTGLDTGAVYGGVLSAGVFDRGVLTDILSVRGLDAGRGEARWR